MCTNATIRLCAAKNDFEEPDTFLLKDNQQVTFDEPMDSESLVERIYNQDFMRPF